MIGSTVPRQRSVSVPSVVAAALCSVLLTLSGCGDEGNHAEQGEGPGAVQTARADSIYSPETFDTVTWASDSLRLLRGNEIYASECRRCHGYLGRGNTEYTDDRDLAVPSLVTPDWEYGRDLRGALRQIFVGHGDGMPSWGLGRLTPRQIQAATYYVLYQLRPEVLGDSTDSDS